ncbi:siderophore-iron reductase FhuF [Pseudochelatococcus sp. B33]
MLDIEVDDRFAYCRDKLLLAAPADNENIPCRTLTDNYTFNRIVGNYGRRYPSADRRAVVSMWTQYYFGVLLTASTVQRLVHRRRLRLGLNELVLSSNAAYSEPAAFVLPESGTDGDDESIERDLLTILDNHVAPLSVSIAANTGLSPRLLWNNVAGYLDWIIREIGRQVDPTLAERALPILDRPEWPEGRRNPMFGMLRATRDNQGEWILQRKVCCLRYCLPGVAGCGEVCPLPSRRAGDG